MSRYQLYFVAVVILAIIAAYIVATIPMRRGLDIDGGVRVLFEVDKESAGTKWPTNPEEQKRKMQSIRRTMEMRVKGRKELAESLVVPSGSDRIRVEIPGIRDEEKALKYIGSAASLDFYHLKNVVTKNNPLATWKMDVSKKPGEESEYTFTSTGIGAGKETINSVTDPEGVLNKVVEFKNKMNAPELTGSDVDFAKADIDQSEGGPVVLLTLNNSGKDKFAKFTRENVGEILAIFFDGKLQTAPEIKEEIPSGECRVSGFSSLKEAKRVSELINSGALPVPLRVINSQKVEPTLGTNTVQQVMLAGAVGLALVVLFMIFYYKLPGVLASIALCLYALFTISVFTLMKYPMSLSGIAALIISIGMAVDANILIFERLKEELKNGKTLRSAIDAGFSRAFHAILDSNVCTAITCVILMWYGSPTVYSFALTLLIGVAISMFTAITVTRTMLHLLIGNEWAQNPSHYGLSQGWLSHTGLNWDIVGKRNWYFILSGILIIPGLICLSVFGLKPGIEFKSGTEFTVQFSSPQTLDNVRNIVIPFSDDQKGSGIEVQMASEGTMAFIKTDWKRGSNEAESNAYLKKCSDFESSLSSSLPVLKNAESGEASISKTNVEPTISKELTINAIKCVLFASIGIILYLTIRFAIGGLAAGLRFGVCAVLALIHDAAFIIGGFAILGKLANWEVDSIFVTAILTIIGFSVHDTIVVYDRIRENMRHRGRGETFEALANKSILQTLSRSINTSLTVVITLIALIALGGPMLRHFYITMLAGIIIGTYSSIFNATPLVIVWDAIASGVKLSSKGISEKPLVEKPMVPQTSTKSEQESSTETSSAIDEKTGRVKRKSGGKKRRF